ncbi:HEAT repeat domain-containing protein [Oscillatoria sp. FACHB-1406]|uniref:HEAT repeat domain-containing protein n=1 Tax=Oscillatoria sp. FACHB-1406 TaxID=2692846 RepID=UPI00168A215C|nr:HEAT repeat domain-containing protein [Oscillatoria sp. FACHB-1406]MBD2577645.1 HEAT repeat domain-containing protein [Oscillatoria sp. FACHB-1406]
MNPPHKQDIKGGAQERLTFVEQCLQQLILCTNDSCSKETQETLLELGLTVLERGDFKERWEVAKIIPKLGTMAIAPLAEIIQDESADLEERWFAARILAGFDRDDAILALAQVLATTEDSDLIEIAANALANFGAAAVRVLAPLLECSPLQRVAARALAQIHSPEAIAPLLTIARAPDATLRATAIEALANFRDPRIISVLIEALGDLEAPIRKEAAIGLGFRADSAAEYNLLAHLRPLLYDFHLEVCQQAAIAIGKMPGEEAECYLSETLQSPLTPVPLQLTLIQALAWRETASSLAYLQQALPFLSEQGILALLRALGRIRSEALKGQAARILLDFYESQHPQLVKMQIEQALAHSLGQLQDKKGISVLQLLANSPKNSVKLHAIAALKRFPNSPNDAIAS